METNVVYISGLFENTRSKLSRRIKNGVEKHNYKFTEIDLYKNCQFGSYSFSKEIARIKKIIKKINPNIIIAHSLGAYIAVQIKKDCLKILLEPSLSVKEMFFSKEPNNSKPKIKLSNEFIDSIKNAPSIEKVAKLEKAKNVYIIGAKKGGHHISKKYHLLIPQSYYKTIKDADHNFSNKIISIKNFKF